METMYHYTQLLEPSYPYVYSLFSFYTNQSSWKSHLPPFRPYLAL